MTAKQLLYNAYTLRTKAVSMFFIFTTALSVLFLIIGVVDLSMALMWAGFGISFFCFIPLYFCGSIKKGLKQAKPKIDYLFQCVGNLDDAQKNTIPSEAAIFFKGLANRERIHFGDSCLYGRIRCADWRDVNYHVILPYRNIKRVYLHKSMEKNIKQKLAEAASVASLAITAASMVAGVGGTLLFSQHNAVFVIMDDGGHFHRMACGAASPKMNELIANYVAEISVRSPYVEIGYIR